MPDREVDLRERFGTFRQIVESGEKEVEKGTGNESSSSSDGSNELPPPNLAQSATSFLQRPQVTFESSIANLPPVTGTMSIAPSPHTANLLPRSTLGAEASAQIAVPAGMFQLGGSSEEEVKVRSQNQLVLFPSPERQQSIRSASGNTASTYHLRTSNLPLEFRLDSSNFGSSRTNPQLHHPLSPISTTSGNIGSPFARTSLQPLHLMQEPSPTFGFGPQDHRYQHFLGQGMGTGSNSFHPFQSQNVPIQKGMGSGMGLSLPLQLESMQFPNNSNAKMKMIWQDNNPPMPNLYPFGGSQAQFFNFPNTIRYFRNSVYDPMYEAMGLPVDPHLRMFNARRDTDGDE